MKLIFTLHKETKIPKRIRETVPRSGSADESVKYLRKNNDILVSPEDVQEYLSYIGAWTKDELKESSHETNIERLLWIACLNCQENKTCWFYMGI